MAEVRSGSFATSGYSDPGWPDHYVFSWSLASQSIVDNTSTISWTLAGAGADTSGRYTGVKEKYVTVNGSTQSDATLVYTYNGTVAFRGTTVIKHNSEGKASFSASAGGAFFSYGSYNSTGSGSWTLPTIARATTPTFSATSVTMGGSITITLTPAVSSFKHKLRYSFGSLSQQVSGFSEGNDFTPSGNRTVTFTPPVALANQIPNASSGVCSILCYTYNSSGTHIGTVTKTITLNVPSYEPQITAITLTGSNLLSGEYVQGKSAVTIKITASSSYGATIKAYSTVFDGKTYTGNSFKTSTLSSPGGSMSRAAMVTVTDTRGKTKILSSSSITVHPYSIPSITGFTLTRQSDGTTVIAVVNGAVSSVNSKNAKTVKVVLNGVTQNKIPTAYSISESITFTNVPTDSTLTGTATITDSYTNVQKSVVLPTVAVTMDFYKDGTGIAMGKVAESSGLLDVAWNIKNASVPTLLGGLGKSIPSNADINTTEYIIPGNYVCSQDGIAKTLKNAPSTSAFKMMVYNCLDVLTNVDSGNYVYLVREITNYNSKKWIQYARKEGGAWQFSSWRLLLDNDSCRDYVVEQGTTNGWEYTKWNSGKIEMITERSLNFPALEKQADYLWRSIVSLDLSGYLKRVISGTCAIQVNGMVPQVCRHGTNLATAEIVIVTSRSSGAFTVSAPLYIIGKWK